MPVCYGKIRKEFHLQNPHPGRQKCEGQMNRSFAGKVREWEKQVLV